MQSHDRYKSYGEIHQYLNTKDPIREEYRYIRYLLWMKGIEFYYINDDLIMYIRNNVSKLITPGEVEIVQYVIQACTTRELILNTKEEYLEYLATNPVLRIDPKVEMSTHYGYWHI